jgi:putative GTP pyrophosphokinase
MKSDISTLRNEYELKKSQYKKLCIEVKAQLSELLRLSGITLALPIESRVKSWESISQKCERGGITPATLEEIGDIAGLRIVLLFKRDQEKVCEIIRQFFEVLEAEDKASRLSSDQFGYGSIHFQVRPKAEWLVLPTLSELQGLQAEIQVRTASQHIWAEASHALQYKRESHVPMPLRRAINRVAALLETVDLEFERVLSERGTYVEQLGKFEEGEPLNTDILEKVLAEELPPENRLENEPFGMLLDDLIAFNINNAKSLKALLKKHHDAILADEASIIKDIREKKGKTLYIQPSPKQIDKGVFFSHVGLARHALGLEFGNEFRSYLLKKLIKSRQSSKKDLR